MREAAPPAFVFDTPLPYTHLQQMFDEGAPWGIRGYEKAVYLDELTDPAIDVIAQHLPKKSSPMSFMPTFVLGGDYARHPDAETAFGGSRQTRYVVNIAAVAPTAELLEADRGMGAGVLVCSRAPCGWRRRLCELHGRPRS